MGDPTKITIDLLTNIKSTIDSMNMNLNGLGMATASLAQNMSMME